MDKTKQALDDLISSIVEVIPRLLTKATSSRVLATVGSLFGAYMVATQSGLQGMDAVIAAAAVVVSGGTYVISKSVQHVAEAKVVNSMIGEVTPVTNAPPKASPPPPTKHYMEAPNVQGWVEVAKSEATGKDNPAFFAAEIFDGTYYQRVNLGAYNPEIRLDIAQEMNLAAINLHEASFKEIVGISAPMEGEIYDHETKEEFRIRITKSRKECVFPSEHDDFQLNDILELYTHKENMEKLQGKTIDWDKFNNTPSELGRLGLKAV